MRAVRHLLIFAFLIGLPVAPALAPERYAMLSAAYRDHYMAREAAIPLFAGARELLDELAEAGYLLAVATGKSRWLDRMCCC